ncbi:MAG: PAS domain S-box protein [Deltaproteobacteria bacterium]|nr:PAS domain S-box protein [Deltaproteobacteria bacterium]
MPASKKVRNQKSSSRAIPPLERKPRDGRSHDFLAYTSEGFFRCLAGGRFREVNPALARLLGYNSPTEVLSLSLGEDVYARLSDEEQVISECAAGGFISGKEFLWKRKNGEAFPILLYARASKSARGRVVEYEGMVVDLSAQAKGGEPPPTNTGQVLSFEDATHIAAFVYRGSAILYANPAAELLSGYAQEELRELSFWDLIHPDFRQTVRDRASARSHREPAAKRYEIKFVTRNGEERWVDFGIGGIEIEGNPAIVGTAIDITSRKRAQAELEQSQELFLRFVEHSPACAYLKDETGKYVYINKSTERSFPNILGKTDLDFFSAATAREVRGNDVAAMMSGHVSKFDETMESVEGVRHWTSFKFPIALSSGKKLLAGFCLDVTKQQKLEEQLRESEERYRTIAEMTSDYAYALRVEANGELTLEWTNAGFSRLSGLTSEEVLGRGGWLNLPHPEDILAVQRHRESALAGQEQTSEFRIIAKSGEVRWLRDSIRPVWERELGRVVRIYGAGRDITERRRMEQQLRERAIQPKDLGVNLRRFRQHIGLTQSVFGQSFGGYSQRQITSYETGEIEIPMGLLLAIRNKGYPLEAVLGESQTDALDKIVGYLSASWKIHETAKHLTESVSRLLDRESATVSSIMSQLGAVVEEEPLKESHTLRDILRRAGIEPAAAVAEEELVE